MEEVNRDEEKIMRVEEDWVQGWEKIDDGRWIRGEGSGDDMNENDKGKGMGEEVLGKRGEEVGRKEWGERGED
jgi:hypothetical protein